MISFRIIFIFTFIIADLISPSESMKGFGSLGKMFRRSSNKTEEPKEDTSVTDLKDLKKAMSDFIKSLGKVFTFFPHIPEDLSAIAKINHHSQSIWGKMHLKNSKNVKNSTYFEAGYEEFVKVSRRIIQAYKTLIDDRTSPLTLSQTQKDTFSANCKELMEKLVIKGTKTATTDTGIETLQNGLNDDIEAFQNAVLKDESEKKNAQKEKNESTLNVSSDKKMTTAENESKSVQFGIDGSDKSFAPNNSSAGEVYTGKPPSYADKPSKTSLKKSSSGNASPDRNVEKEPKPQDKARTKKDKELVKEGIAKENLSDDSYPSASIAINSAKESEKNIAEQENIPVSSKAKKDIIEQPSPVLENQTDQEDDKKKKKKKKRDAGKNSSQSSSESESLEPPGDDSSVHIHTDKDLKDDGLGKIEHTEAKKESHELKPEGDGTKISEPEKAKETHLNEVKHENRKIDSSDQSDKENGKAVKDTNSHILPEVFMHKTPTQEQSENKLIVPETPRKNIKAPKPNSSHNSSSLEESGDKLQPLPRHANTRRKLSLRGGLDESFAAISEDSMSFSESALPKPRSPRDVRVSDSSFPESDDESVGKHHINVGTPVEADDKSEKKKHTTDEIPFVAATDSDNHKTISPESENSPRKEDHSEKIIPIVFENKSGEEKVIPREPVVQVMPVGEDLNRLISIRDSENESHLKKHQSDEAIILPGPAEKPDGKDSKSKHSSSISSSESLPDESNPIGEEKKQNNLNNVVAVAIQDKKEVKNSDESENKSRSASNTLNQNNSQTKKTDSVQQEGMGIANLFSLNSSSADRSEKNNHPKSKDPSHENDALHFSNSTVEVRPESAVSQDSQIKTKGEDRSSSSSSDGSNGGKPKKNKKDDKTNDISQHTGTAVENKVERNNSSSGGKDDHKENKEKGIATPYTPPPIGSEVENKAVEGNNSSSSAGNEDKNKKKKAEKELGTFLESTVASAVPSKKLHEDRNEGSTGETSPRKSSDFNALDGRGPSLTDSFKKGNGIVEIDRPQKKEPAEEVKQEKTKAKDKNKKASDKSESASGSFSSSSAVSYSESRQSGEIENSRSDNGSMKESADSSRRGRNDSDISDRSPEETPKNTKSNSDKGESPKTTENGKAKTVGGNLTSRDVEETKHGKSNENNNNNKPPEELQQNEGYAAWAVRNGMGAVSYVASGIWSRTPSRATITGFAGRFFGSAPPAETAAPASQKDHKPESTPHEKV